MKPDWEICDIPTVFETMLQNFKFKTFIFKGPGFYSFDSGDSILIFQANEGKYNVLVYNSRDVKQIINSINKMDVYKQ